MKYVFEMDQCVLSSLFEFSGGCGYGYSQDAYITLQQYHNNNFLCHCHLILFASTDLKPKLSTPQAGSTKTESTFVSDDDHG